MEREEVKDMFSNLSILSHPLERKSCLRISIQSGESFGNRNFIWKFLLDHRETVDMKS